MEIAPNKRGGLLVQSLGMVREDEKRASDDALRRSRAPGLGVQLGLNGNSPFTAWKWIYPSSREPRSKAGMSVGPKSPGSPVCVFDSRHLKIVMVKAPQDLWPLFLLSVYTIL